MTLPSLKNWEPARDALHQIAKVIGALRVACSDPLPNDLHYSLDVTATGFSGGIMRGGGLLDFNLKTLRLRFTRGKQTVFALDVAGHSQLSLMRETLAAFADCGCSITPSMKRVIHDETFILEPALVADSLTALDAMYTALARFRAKLSGFMTPLVLWPHHFDTAFICFPSDQINEHSDPQIAFGFAPASPGLDRPYIYAYAWSEPTGYLDLPLTPPARAITEGYTGLFLAYDDLRDSPEFASTVESALLDYQSLAAPRLA